MLPKKLFFHFIIAAKGILNHCNMRKIAKKFQKIFHGLPGYQETVAILKTFSNPEFAFKVLVLKYGSVEHEDEKLWENAME